MSIYKLDPDKDCRFCNHAQRETKNGIAVDSAKMLYCPVKKCYVDYECAIEAGTECEDRDTNRDWVAIDHAITQGREYQRTGDVRVLCR